jgi:hypothetical protein
MTLANVQTLYEFNYWTKARCITVVRIIPRLRQFNGNGTKLSKG